jgi:hypothetical protein
MGSGNYLLGGTGFQPVVSASCPKHRRSPELWLSNICAYKIRDSSYCALSLPKICTTRAREIRQDAVQEIL